MVDRRPKPKTNPLDKKVPKNPRYQKVSSVVDSGKNINQVEVMSNQTVAKRKGELFRRIKPSTLSKLIQESGPKESIYQLGRDEEEYKESIEDSASVYSAAPSQFSVVTVNTEALGLNAETEFILLDIREPDEYSHYRIKDAINFPAPNITRDRILPEVFRMVNPNQKNQPGKLIIIYAWDERPGVEAAQKFSQRDYSNIYLVSGGLEQFVKDCYDLLEGPRLPPRPKEPISPARTTKTRSTISQAGFTGMSRK